MKEPSQFARSVLGNNSHSMTKIDLGSPPAAISVFPLNESSKNESGSNNVMCNYASRSLGELSMSD